MTIGSSGQSSPIIGLYPEDYVAPQASTNFVLREAPGLRTSDSPDELALLKFRFTKPTKNKHVVSSSLTPPQTDFKVLRITGVAGDTVTVIYNDGAATPETYTWEVALIAGTGDDAGYTTGQIDDTNLVSEEATPVGPADYSALPIINFTAESALTDLAGFRLYMSESLMTPTSYGSEIHEYLYSDSVAAGDVSKITLNSSGIVEFQFAALTSFYNGRKMYFAVTHIDNAFPAPNESEPDINVWGITIPGQQHLLDWVLDLSNPSAPKITLTLDNITDGGYNPHLKEMMGTDITPTQQFSENGGFDIYRKTLTQIDFTDGYYEPIDATQGQIVDSQILLGQIVCVIDAGMRQAWQVLCTTAGIVVIDDTSLISGSRSGISYLTERSSLNFTVYSGTIDTSTDSIIPYSSDPTPVKQYLTDSSEEYDDEDITVGTVYGYTAASIDTQLDYGKVS